MFYHCLCLSGKVGLHTPSSQHHIDLCLNINAIKPILKDTRDRHTVKNTPVGSLTGSLT